MKYNLPDCGVRFYESPRGYWLGLLELQGITGILSRHLFPKQYDSVPEYILKAAAERGSTVHDLCREYDMFGTYSLPETDDEKIEEFIKAYAGLVEHYKPKNVSNEYLVTDGTHYASAIDKVFVMDGKLCLGDIKTTYSLNKDYVSWQLSIYKYLFERQTGLKVEGLYAIWLREGGKMMEVPDKGSERVEKLLEADRIGELYQDKPETTALSADLKAVEALEALKGVMVQIEEAQALEKDLKAKVELMFDELGIDSWETDWFKITRIKASPRKVFNLDSFMKEHNDVYKEYVEEKLNEAKLKKEHKHLYEDYVYEDGIARKEHVRINKKW